jgi:hypothetical protein
MGMVFSLRVCVVATGIGWSNISNTLPTGGAIRCTQYDRQYAKRKTEKYSSYVRKIRTYAIPAANNDQRDKYGPAPAFLNLNQEFKKLCRD